MYFHAPCGVVLYFAVCKLYVNKEKNLFCSSVIRKGISNHKNTDGFEMS